MYSKYHTRRAFVSGATVISLMGRPSSTYGASTQSVFGALSTAEEVTAGLDLSGTTAVITGCNSGIGYETMRVLALRGAHVIGTARTSEKAREACSNVVGKASPAVLELSDFDSVRDCAREIHGTTKAIDMLILNAGVSLGRDLQQINGIERHFVINHLGHFIFAHHLIDRVTEARQGRVVVLGSRQHRNVPPGGIQFDNLSGKGWSTQGYGHSKLANGLFSLELARRLKNTQATSNCVHPGVTRTNILRYIPLDELSGLRYDKSVEQGAATPCYVATNPALAAVSGEYFVDCNPAEQSSYQIDKAMAARLWAVSTDLTKRYL
jgi:NAD(P)-dependent dehydrogenase (short-subunit alcohol dehydrogenase family)